MSVIQFKITNLTCDACVRLSREALMSIPGAIRVTVDLGTGRGHLEADRFIPFTDLEKALKEVDKSVIPA